MRSQMKLLSLTVRATVILLTVSAFLVVLGIFDGYRGFVWHHLVRNGNGKIRAVLQIQGNPHESFREYQAVAAAAEQRAGERTKK